MPHEILTHHHVYRTGHAAAMAARTLIERWIHCADEETLRAGEPVEARISIEIDGCEDTVRIFHLGGTPRTDLSREALNREINRAVGFEDDFLE